MKNKISLLSMLFIGLTTIETATADCPRGISYYEFHIYYKKHRSYEGYRLFKEDKELTSSWIDPEEDAFLLKATNGKCIYKLAGSFFPAFVLKKVEE